MKILMPLFTLLSLMLTPASAQMFDPAGSWSCTVFSQSSEPARNYGLEVDMQVAANGTLYARGVLIFPQLRNSLQQVEGPGDWIVLPPEPPLNQVLYKFRMKPVNYPFVSWFVRPLDNRGMYNLFSNPLADGTLDQVETQCTRTR